MSVMKFLFILFSFTLAFSSLRAQRVEVGIVQDMENDSLLQASGYRWLIESVAKCFSPKKLSDQQFQERLPAIKRLKTTLFAVNIFIPGELKLVGPSVDQLAILSYVETVFQRCQEANVAMIVWGSGGARRIPDGFDKSQATEQFVDIARKVSLLAEKYKILIVLEGLNRGETNFINTLSEAYAIAVKVNHPNFMLNADIYHMLKENEPPASIEMAAPYIRHCEIAEKENRTPPGTQGDDFREYLRALKKINYKGKIFLECRWSNISLQALPARLALQKQIDEVWK
jgi:sugar phosphate isomerase/epimerase